MTLDDVDVMLDQAGELLDRGETYDQGVAIVVAVNEALAEQRQRGMQDVDAPGDASDELTAAREHGQGWRMAGYGEGVRAGVEIAAEERDQAQHERDEAIRENERLTKELAVVTKERDVAGVRWVWLDRVASWLYTLPERGGDRA